MWQKHAIDRSGLTFCHSYWYSHQTLGRGNEIGLPNPDEVQWMGKRHVDEHGFLRWVGPDGSIYGKRFLWLPTQLRGMEFLARDGTYVIAAETGAVVFVKRMR